MATSKVPTPVKLGDLIRNFDGDGCVETWLDKVKLVCQMQGISDVSQVIPLFLEGPAFAVFKQLDSATKKDAGLLETALLSAFAMNAFQAYDELRVRGWRDNEPVDVFLAELQRLASLADIKDDNLLKCAFVVGLPMAVSAQLRASAQISKLTLSGLVQHARILMTEFTNVGGSVAAAGRIARGGDASMRGGQAQSVSSGDWSFKQRQDRRRGREIICFFCGLGGHIARLCPKRADQQCASGVSIVKSSLPIIKGMVDGMAVRTLVDSGCSKCVLSSRFRRTSGCNRSGLSVLGGSVIRSKGQCQVLFRSVEGGEEAMLNCLVLDYLIDGVDFILAMDGISRLGGAFINREGQVRFGDMEAEQGASMVVLESDKSLRIDDQDFEAEFDGTRWLMKWRWNDGEPMLRASCPIYAMASDIEEAFNEEFEEWIRLGIVVPAPEGSQPTLSMMAVVQENKRKVRPVLDYRPLNSFVSSHSGDAEVCADKLRCWRQMGGKLAILDLRRAYLQVHVDESQWKHQVVEYNGRCYYLTRLGFGMNCAPKVMSAIVSKVLSMDDMVSRSTDHYVDDIIVNESQVSVETVRDLISKYGLQCKEPEKLCSARVLGLQITVANDGELRWGRGNEVPAVPDELSKRELFSLTGRLVGHFPVCNWLRVACSYVKRHCGTVAWDDPVDPDTMERVRRIVAKVFEADPAHGKWHVAFGGDRTVNVWCDASSIATGVVLETGGVVIEDSAWLRPMDDGHHINVAELEAAIKGINLACKWNVEKIVVMTDSASVYAWLQSALEKTTKPRVQGLSEAVIRRRLSLVSRIGEECGVEISVKWVASRKNIADALTRVDKSWLRPSWDTDSGLCCSGSLVSETRKAVEESHRWHHFGVDKTLHFARMLCGSVTRKDAEAVVAGCQVCRSIDPASIRWNEGSLSVEKSWYRLAVDVTHFGGKCYLTVVDCGPSRFAVWRYMKSEDAGSVVDELNTIFLEHGPPVELLLDNACAFRSKTFKAMCEKWRVLRRFRCAYKPGGNGVVERNHRTIKRMAARVGADPRDMTFWYNMAPRGGKDSASPAQVLFKYGWRCYAAETVPEVEDAEGGYQRGDPVFVKPPATRCTTVWPRGMVTGVVSETNVEVDGIPRHVSDLRQVPAKVEESSDGESDSTGCPEVSVPDRPRRVRAQPWRYDSADFDKWK